MGGPEAMVGMTFFGMTGLAVISFSPIGRAFARRLGGGKDTAADIEDLRADVAELRAALDDARTRTAGELDEVHNRLDFAERMLASKDKNALPGGR